MAYRMGVQTHLQSYAAEAIGGLTLGVTPLEMSVVYATLADGGWRNSPIAITKVVFPDGHVDSSWGRPHRVKVLSEAITGEETNILHQNVLGGTAVRSAISCPTAAKTGTTSEFIDAWLDGYNSEFATVVWMGYPNRRVSMTDVHGELQQGGALPAVIWKTYMSAVTEGKPCPELPTSSKEAISYKPFYGHYASTGQAQTGSALGTGGAVEAPAQRHRSRGGRGGNRHGERPVLEVDEAPPPKAPAPPAAQPQTPAPQAHEPAAPQGGGGHAGAPATGGAAPP
jgi:membrane peptidoglycan carboxypeptidase